MSIECTQADVLLIIPAYNEEENIIRVVKDIQAEFPQFDYIIVNDGSIDKTKDLCIENHLDYINYSVNLGLKMAVLGGVDYALLKGYKYAIQYDGDGQHDASYINKMIQMAEKEQLDVVIGSRFLMKKKPYSLRMLGSRLLSWSIKVTTNHVITDPTSGMRLYSNRVLELMSKQTCFGPEPDFVAHLILKGLRVRETPVIMKDRLAGDSYLNFWRSIKYMTLMLGSILIMERFRE